MANFTQANTFPIISYANTFGDWMVSTNNLLNQNNDLAANNFIKPTGTVYLQDASLGLQVSNNAIVGGQLQSVGIGSGLTVQYNAVVGGQLTLTNTSSSLISSGAVQLNGPNTALSVANNVTIGGSLTAQGNVSLLGSVSYSSNKLTLSSTNPNPATAAFGVYRTNSASNASIQWSESNMYWSINDVITGNFYRILTDNYAGSAGSYANTALQYANSAGLYANAAYLSSNIQSVSANAVISAAFNFTAGVDAGQNTSIFFAYQTANSAGVYANAAFVKANTTASLLSTSSNVQFNMLGVGTTPAGNNGDIVAIGNITAYYSDDRLKTRLGNIENALDKVMQLSGFYYEANEVAQSLGYPIKKEVGVSAQEVQNQLPEVVVPAPIDNKYLTVHYERLVPLLVEAIKELKTEIDEIKNNLVQ